MAASGPRQRSSSRPRLSVPGDTRPVIAHGFLFADIRGYTGFVEANGNRAGADLVDRYRSIVRGAVAASGGAEIRTEGDSFFVVFDSASAAVGCGLAIIDAAGRPGAAGGLAVGVGIHAGEAVETADGFVGSAVNIASRLCAQAAAGEVLVSDTVRSLARGSIDAAFVSLGERHLKGVDEPIAVFRVTAGSSSPDRSHSSRRVGPTRRFAVAATAVVAAIALVAALGAIAWPRAGAFQPDASTPASAPPVGSDVTAASDSGSIDAVRHLTPAELALLDRIPLEFQPYCERSTVEEGAAGGNSSLRCDLRDTPGYGADTVWYDAFDTSTRGDMAVVIAELAGEAGLGAVEGGTADVLAACETSGEALGRWDFYTTFAGRLACYRRDGAAWLAWTYEGQDILARAVRLDGDAGRLVDWWDERAGAYLR